MYERVVSRVKVNNGLSSLFTPLVGVRQGCNLSPTLFNTFINDIIDLFDSSCDPLHMTECEISCLLYADDLILLSQSENGLQKCLDRLNCYLKKWKMKINIKKTKIIIFNRSGKIFKGKKFKIGKQPIQITDSYVYLGITFTSSGSFSLAQQKLSNKATRSLYSFLSEINIYKGASVATILTPFDSLVNPILLFNCEIWGCFLKSFGSKYNKFVSKIFDERIIPETMHNKVCKMALGVHSKASNLAVKGELGRFPLHIIIYKRIFKYFMRLISFSNNTILSSALEANIHMDNMGKHSWFTTVKHLLQFTKLDETTLDLANIENNKISNLVKKFNKNLSTQFQVYWLNILNKDRFGHSVSNKLSLYSEIKNEIRFEPYLKLIKNVNERVAVTKMRISCHLLPSKAGRYKKVPRDERFCSFCKPSIGNEFHYLMKCKHSSFSLLRSAFLECLYKINSNFMNMTDKALFIYILTMHDENVVNLSAQYIDNIQNCYKSMKDDESFSSSNVNI